VKICVLVKEVPDAAVEKRIDPSTGRLDRSGEKNLNPFDTHAIEAAMQLKEGGALQIDEVVASPWAPTRRSRAAQGRLAGRGPLRSTCSDDALAGSTSTGRATRSPRRCAEAPDLVLLGQQSDDGECYTIGAVVADHLQAPVAHPGDQGRRGGRQAALRAPGGVRLRHRARRAPGVISVGDAINEPRYPSLKAIMGAKKKPLEKVGGRGRRHRADRVGHRERRAPTATTSTRRPPSPPARSSRTRTRTRRSRRSSPGSTRGS
jgi:electron transfer flavoprotein beta subunit